MSGWNYRIVKQVNWNGQADFFDIREVFYDDGDVPNAMDSEPSSIYGETLEDLQKDFFLFQKAFHNPYLVFDWSIEDFIKKK